MTYKGCKMKRLLAMILMVLVLLPAIPANAQGYSAAVTPEKLTVYADEGLTKKLSTLKRYTIVTVNDVEDGVACFDYKGYTLYANASKLKALEDFATKAVVNENSRVYAEPDTDSENIKLAKGTQVYLLATSGNWAMIESMGNVGYTYAGHLTPEDTYEEDDDEDDEEADEPAGEYDDVVIKEIDAVVTAASLKVYKSASTSSKNLGSLPFGQKVLVMAYNSEWAYIALNGNYGFCKLSGLAKVSGNNSQPQPEPEDEKDDIDLSDAIPATVTDESVNVYASASTSARKLGTLKEGAEVNVVDYNSIWAYIELNGNFGYCHISALTRSSELDKGDKDDKDDDDRDDEDDDNGIVGDGKTVIGTATVTFPATPIFASASTNSASTTLAMGTTLDMYARNPEWAYVNMNGSFGFVQLKNLNIGSYVELKTGDTGSAVRDLEEALLKLGYLDTVPGPTYSTTTAAAVRRLQAACGMAESGNADEATLRILYSGNAPVSPIMNMTLAMGDVTANVTRMQTRLYHLGYFAKVASIDGEFGNKSVSAVKLFQGAAGLAVTGTADAATMQALYKVNAPSLPSGQKAPDASSSGSNYGTSYIYDMPNDLASFTSEYSETMSNVEKLEYVIHVAQNQLGKPYIYGTSGTSSFDCSGFTSYCFKQINIKLKRSAYAQGYDDDYTKVSAVEDLKRGDLVYFNTLSDSDLSDHSGIYLGNNHFIHASSGAGKVVVSDLSTGYYKRVYSWGHHILET